MNAHSSPIWTLGILASGRSRRMGRDKALLPIGNPEVTLVERVVARCGGPDVSLLISASEDRSLPESVRGVPRVSDEFPEAGPLAGFAALRAAAKTPWLVIVPCDMPFLSRRHLEALLEAGQAEAECDQVLFRGARGRYSLPQAIGPNSRSSLVQALQRGDNRLLGWVPDETRTRVLNLEGLSGVDEIDFENLNEPEAYQRACERARKEALPPR